MEILNKLSLEVLETLVASGDIGRLVIEDGRITGIEEGQDGR